MTDSECPWRDESLRCELYWKQELKMRSRIYNALRGNRGGR